MAGDITGEMRRYGGPTLPTMGALTAGAIAIGIGLPLYLPIPGLESVPILAQILSVVAAIVFLPGQLFADAGGRRPGSAMRLAVLTMAASGAVAWLAGTLVNGFSFGAALSLLNWIALGALVLCGQTFLGRTDRAELLIKVWVWGHVWLSAAIATYLILKFGRGLLESTNRGPFQDAAHAIITAWPNYYGTALAVAVCYPFAQLLSGRASKSVWLALPVLLLTVLMTFSRTAMLVTVAGLLVMTVASGRALRMLPIALVTVAILLAIGALLPAVGFQFEAILRPGSGAQMGVLERYAYSLEALRLWREHPLFGIGFARFDEFADVSRIVQLAGYQEVTVGSVHNEYITSLLKGGLLGTLGFIVILVMCSRAFLRALRSSVAEVHVLGLAGIGILTVLGVAGFASESFRTLGVAGPFWVLSGGVSVLASGVKIESGEVG